MGTGPPRASHFEYEGCLGACMQYPACNVSTLMEAYVPGSIQYWTGCGYSNAGRFAPVTPGATHPGLNAGNMPAVCAVDCPRTIMQSDDGNPTDSTNLTPQQWDRSITFLFRNKANFTWFARTEIGSTALANRNNDLYDWQGNGPSLVRIVGDGSRQAHGRNFLMSGGPFIGPEPPSPPPPSTPPPRTPSDCSHVDGRTC